MNIQNNKKASTIAMILLLASVALIATIQSTMADTPNVQEKTYAFIIANPNPIGVNQQLLVTFWIADPPPGALGAYGPRWTNFTVTITKPDGTTENKGPYTSDPIGGAWLAYTPTSIGTYKFQMSYSGQTISGLVAGLFGPPTTINNTYLPSTSTIYSVVVQEQAATTATQNPLPTNYWTRPILGTNLDWSSISSNWLMASWNSTDRSFDAGSAYSPEGTSPNSAHILWTKSMGFGGLTGGIYGTDSYYNGASYEQWLTPPTIINGYLYYNSIVAQEPITSGNMGSAGIVCVDMRTGQTAFTIPNASLAFGQIFNYISPNQAGTYSYLWDTSGPTWRMFDAASGNFLLSIDNPPAGTITFGPNGEILVYSASPTGALSMWNSSRALHPPGYPWIWATEDWMWRPIGGTFITQPAYTPGITVNGTAGIQWTASLTSTVGQSISGFKDNALVTAALVGSNVEFTGYSMNDGSLLWHSTATPPAGLPNPFGGSFGVGGTILNGVFYTYIKQTLQWVAYDVQTGQQLWITQPTSSAWGMYNTAGNIGDNNNFYTSGYDGMIHAYSKSTGAKVWNFSSGNAGTMTPYGTWPFYGGLVVNDGKVFGVTGDHGNGVSTMYDGEAIYAINAVTGQEVWSMFGWFERPSVADGLLVAHNDYDGQVYCFGKGPSATTVSAPDVSVPSGQSVVIKGTVTDQSPGAKGKPAISDSDMSAWMAYLYEQQVKPANAKGVQVKLTAIDSNGNSHDIGTATSDINGNFAIAYTPPIEGMYQVVATFAGTNSYYGSTQTTYFNVGPAVHASPATTVSPSIAPAPEAAPSTTIYIVAAAAVIIIVVAVAAVFLRKRK